MYAAFIDPEKAYDRVNWAAAVWNVLKVLWNYWKVTRWE